MNVAECVNKVKPIKSDYEKAICAAKYAKNQKLYFIIGYLFGLNRLYLFQFHKVVIYLSYVYTFALLAISWYFAYNSKVGGAVSAVLKYIFVLHFAVLVLEASFRGKTPSIRFYTLLNRFDTILNLKEKDISSFRNWWLLFSFTSELFDCWFASTFVYHGAGQFIMIPILIWYLNRDSELLFHIGNLRHIYLRVSLLRLHVLKVFGKKKSWGQDINNKKLSEVEHLHHRLELDIRSLHHAYETLHKCSTQMNSLTNISMYIMLITTVVTVTFSLRQTVQILGSSSLMNTLDLSGKFTIVFMLTRCVKYLSVVIVPCYLSGVATVEVSAIRGILYDAIRTRRLDTTNHYKAKAFLELIKDSQLTYTLLNVIKMDMTLPLKFLNFCLTYFIIIIQFSKFLD